MVELLIYLQPLSDVPDAVQGLGAKWIMCLVKILLLVDHTVVSLNARLFYLLVNLLTLRLICFLLPTRTSQYVTFHKYRCINTWLIKEG